MPEKEVLPRRNPTFRMEVHDEAAPLGHVDMYGHAGRAFADLLRSLISATSLAGTSFAQLSASGCHEGDAETKASRVIQVS